MLGLNPNVYMIVGPIAPCLVYIADYIQVLVPACTQGVIVGHMLGPFLAASVGFLHILYVTINYKQRRLGHKARIVPQSSFRKLHSS